MIRFWWSVINAEFQRMRYWNRQLKGAALKEKIQEASNPGYPFSIAVSAACYDELRAKLNPSHICLDPRAGKEFLLPCAVFRVPGDP